MTERYEDRDDPGNSLRHHTGEACIERDCDNPAGTAWSPHWCFECNRARMRRATEALEKLIKDRGREA